MSLKVWGTRLKVIGAETLRLPSQHVEFNALFMRSRGHKSWFGRDAPVKIALLFSQLQDSECYLIFRLQWLCFVKCFIVLGLRLAF